jgi:hypothetical protein
MQEQWSSAYTASTPPYVLDFWLPCSIALNRNIMEPQQERETSLDKFLEYKQVGIDSVR